MSLLQARTYMRGHRHASRTFACSSGASRVAVQAPRPFLCAPPHLTRFPSTTTTSMLARGPMGHLAGATPPFKPAGARALPFPPKTIDLGSAPPPGRHHTKPPPTPPSAAPTSKGTFDGSRGTTSRADSSFVHPLHNSKRFLNHRTKTIILPRPTTSVVLRGLINRRGIFSFSSSTFSLVKSLL